MFFCSSASLSASERLASWTGLMTYFWTASLDFGAMVNHLVRRIGRRHGAGNLGRVLPEDETGLHHRDKRDRGTTLSPYLIIHDLFP